MASKESQYDAPKGGRTGAEVLSGVKIDTYKSAGFNSADSVVPKADATRAPGSDSNAQGNPGY